MRIKKRYGIKKLEPRYVMVAVIEAGKDFRGLIRINELSTILWQSTQDGTNCKEKLIKKMLRDYEDLYRINAEIDLNEFLEIVAFALAG